MIVKNKKLTDDEIAQYCQSVNELLTSINERSAAKKGKKTVEAVEEDHITEDEDILALL